jgi:hypothetical protein
MGRLKDFIPSIDRTLAAFAGGMVLSLLELANMCKNHENIGDPYFYLGMLIAGVLGIIGLVVSRSKDLGGAVTAGIAAPQVLAGIAKTGAVAHTVFFSSLIPCAYAQPPAFIPSQDSVTMTIVAESDRPLEVRPMHEKGGYFLEDTLVVRMPKNETIVFSGMGVEPVSLNFPAGDSDQAVIKATLIQEKKKVRKGLLRGMFAQQMGNAQEEKGRLELRVITNDP